MGHLLLPKDNEQVDEGLVNYHSKIQTKNAELYRTLNRFRDHKLMDDNNSSQVRQKKYNLSLPKSTHQRDWHSNLAPNQ